MAAILPSLESFPGQQIQDLPRAEDTPDKFTTYNGSVRLDNGKTVYLKWQYQVADFCGTHAINTVGWEFDSPISRADAEPRYTVAMIRKVGQKLVDLDLVDAVGMGCDPSTLAIAGRNVEQDTFPIRINVNAKKGFVPAESHMEKYDPYENLNLDPLPEVGAWILTINMEIHPEEGEPHETDHSVAVFRHGQQFIVLDSFVKDMQNQLVFDTPQQYVSWIAGRSHAYVVFYKKEDLEAGGDYHYVLEEDYYKWRNGHLTASLEDMRQRKEYYENHDLEGESENEDYHTDEEVAEGQSDKDQGDEKKGGEEGGEEQKGETQGDEGQKGEEQGGEEQKGKEGPPQGGEVHIEEGPEEGYELVGMTRKVTPSSGSLLQKKDLLEAYLKALENSRQPKMREQDRTEIVHGRVSIRALDFLESQDLFEIPQIGREVRQQRRKDWEYVLKLVANNWRASYLRSMFINKDLTGPINADLEHMAAEELTTLLQVEWEYIPLTVGFFDEIALLKQEDASEATDILARWGNDPRYTLAEGSVPWSPSQLMDFLHDRYTIRVNSNWDPVLIVKSMDEIAGITKTQPVKPTEDERRDALAFMDKLLFIFAFSYDALEDNHIKRMFKSVLPHCIYLKEEWLYRVNTTDAAKIAMESGIPYIVPIYNIDPLGLAQLKERSAEFYQYQGYTLKSDTLAGLLKTEYALPDDFTMDDPMPDVDPDALDATIRSLETDDYGLTAISRAKEAVENAKRSIPPENDEHYAEAVKEHKEKQELYQEALRKHDEAVRSRIAQLIPAKEDTASFRVEELVHKTGMLLESAWLYVLKAHRRATQRHPPSEAYQALLEEKIADVNAQIAALQRSMEVPLTEELVIEHGIKPGSAKASVTLLHKGRARVPKDAKITYTWVYTTHAHKKLVWRQRNKREAVAITEIPASMGSGTLACSADISVNGNHVEEVQCRGSLRVTVMRRCARCGQKYHSNHRGDCVFHPIVSLAQSYIAAQASVQPQNRDWYYFLGLLRRSWENTRPEVRSEWLKTACRNLGINAFTPDLHLTISLEGLLKYADRLPLARLLAQLAAFPWASSTEESKLPPTVAEWEARVPANYIRCLSAKLAALPQQRNRIVDLPNEYTYLLRVVERVWDDKTSIQQRHAFSDAISMVRDPLTGIAVYDMPSDDIRDWTSGLLRGTTVDKRALRLLLERFPWEATSSASLKPIARQLLDQQERGPTRADLLGYAPASLWFDDITSQEAKEATPLQRYGYDADLGRWRCCDKRGESARGCWTDKHSLHTAYVRFAGQEEHKDVLGSWPESRRDDLALLSSDPEALLKMQEAVAGYSRNDIPPMQKARLQAKRLKDAPREPIPNGVPKSEPKEEPDSDEEEEEEEPPLEKKTPKAKRARFVRAMPILSLAMKMLTGQK